VNSTRWPPDTPPRRTARACLHRRSSASPASLNAHIAPAGTTARRSSVNLTLHGPSCCAVVPDFDGTLGFALSGIVDVGPYHYGAVFRKTESA
jgi:hypothetical protein